MTDPQWVPFAGLTAVVLLLLLALARASQGVVRDGQGDVHDGEGVIGDGQSDPGGGHSVVDDPVIEGHALAEGELEFEAAHTSANGDPRRGGGHVPKLSDSPDLTTGVLLANVALTQGLFGGALLAGAYFYHIPGAALGVTGDPWVGGLPALAVGVAFGVALWGANETGASLADAVGAAYDEGLREHLAPDTRRGWAVLLGGVLPVVALVEEFIFRAALIGVPAAGFGVSAWALAVFSSGAFAVGHGAQGRVGVAVTGGLGFVLAAGYILSGSLLVVVVAHYLVNALEFLVHEYLGFERLV